MCSTSTKSMPLNVPPEITPPSQIDTGNPLQHSLSAAANAQAPGSSPDASMPGTPPNPSPSTGSPTRPTSIPVTTDSKFGMLLKVLGPALEGGLIGWAGGKGHPQGGFGAASEYFNQKRNQQIQTSMLQQQAQDAAALNHLRQQQAALNAAREERESSRPLYTGAPVQGVDNDPNSPTYGQKIFQRQNPQTGVLETVPGLSPIGKDDAEQVDSERGILINKTKGTYRPIVAESSAGTPTWNSLPTKFNSGSPVITSGSAASPSAIKASSTGGLPLGPRATKSSTMNDLESQAADALRTKHPDWTEDQVYANLKAMGREPKDDGTKANAKLRASLLNQLNKGYTDVETRLTKSINEMKPSPIDSSDDIEAKKQQLRFEAENEKQILHDRLRDIASEQGIVLDGEPQANGNKSLPRTPGSKSAAAPTRPKNVPDEAIWNPQTKTWQLNGAGASQNASRGLPTRPSPKGPKKGDVRLYQGVPYQFDGNSYVRQNPAVAGGS